MQEYLHEVGVKTLDWPANSPDLNTIEHLWDNMGRRLRNHDPLPASLDDVANMLREI